MSHNILPHALEGPQILGEHSADKYRPVSKRVPLSTWARKKLLKLKVTHCLLTPFVV